ncbi:MAG: MarP family serine protease [Nocardioidaceae bacterium]|nr:MarP family serine protease [Nocardioidaceae bacterium]
MSALDIVLVVVAAIYALSGYRQGFIVGAASTGGLLLGGFLAATLTPLFLDGFQPGFSVSVAALLIVLAGAFLGQAVGAFVGGELRRRITWRPARIVDALSGAALSAVAMLLIAWVLGVAASGAQLRGLNEAIRSSAVLGSVDDAMPSGTSRVLSTFNSLVDSSGFPRYLEPFAPERIKEVPAPTPGTVSSAGVRRAGRSVVKVLGSADDCGRALTGSGFTVGRGTVMTNAHVVAGVANPVVAVGENSYSARVVHYDPQVDVAVLRVPRLHLPPLKFATTPAVSEDSAAVLGFPENGPYDVQPARVRDQLTLRSPDIYGEGTVSRDTYSIYAKVRQGNSGGPLVNSSGEILGVIFAASVTDARTGYALTAGQVSAAAEDGSTATNPVSTGACTL